MLHYVKLLLLLATINFILCTEHLSYPEWESKFNEYEKALREQMRPNSMADSILLIHHLDKAVESQPKDWNWKLRATNSTPAPEYHGATEEDAAEILAILKKYKLNETNGTADVNPEKLKHLEAKIKDQSKLYKKTINKFEKPVFRYQRRRQQRRKLRQQIAQKLFGKTGSGTSTIQISVLQTIIIVTSTAYQIYI